MTQWDLEVSELPSRNARINSPPESGEGLVPFFSINVQGTSAEVEAPLTLLVRHVCHRLLDRIPNQGLPELAESLGRIYAFYNVNPISSTVLPPPTQRVTVKRGKTYQRPDFPIVPE